MPALVDLRSKIASTIMEREKDPTFEISEIFSHFSKAIESASFAAPPQSKTGISDDSPIIRYADLQIDKTVRFEYEGEDSDFVLTIYVDNELRFLPHGRIIVNCHTQIYAGYGAGPIAIANDPVPLSAEDAPPRSGPAQHGSDGANVGSRGQDGRDAEYDSTSATEGQNGGKGDDGSPGADGLHGIDGEHGRRGKDITLIVNAFLNGASVTITSTGGDGGKGGRGQRGGNGGSGRQGGQGGKGGDGNILHRAKRGGDGGPGGHAAPGGRGGDHGRNGNAGDGGDCRAFYRDPDGWPMAGSVYSRPGEPAAAHLVPAFGGAHGQPGEGGKRGGQGESFPGRSAPPVASPGKPGNPVRDTDGNGLAAPGDTPVAGRPGHGGVQDGPRQATEKDLSEFVLAALSMKGIEHV